MHDFAGSTPLRHGESGVLTVLFCGCFRFDGLEHTLVGSSLQPLLRIRGSQGRPDPYVESLLGVMGTGSCVVEPVFALDDSSGWFAFWLPRAARGLHLRIRPTAAPTG